MNCRNVFSNMERWGTMVEKTYRNWFSKTFDWFHFNKELFVVHAGMEIIADFEPTFIKKSGKHTYGSGYFWSGARQCSLRGLEIGCLALVDTENETAMHCLAKQTTAPSKIHYEDRTRIHHYRDFIAEMADRILKITEYLVADGYFMKKEFIIPLVKIGLHIITKTRRDANLMFIFKGKPNKGRGRKKLYYGKIAINDIDKRRKPKQYEDEHMKVYGGVVYSVHLKCKVLAAFVYYNGKDIPEIYKSTDCAMEVMTLCQYYA